MNKLIGLVAATSMLSSGLAPQNVAAQDGKGAEDQQLVSYLSFRYLEGANESCELLSQSQISALDLIIRNIKPELVKRYSEAALEKGDQYENGKEKAVGCPTREQDPGLWGMVDQIRATAKGMSIAPAYMTSDPEKCSYAGRHSMPRSQWEHYRGAVLSDKRNADSKPQIEAIAKEMARGLDEDCPKPSYGGRTGTSNYMRPAMVQLTQMEEINDAMQRKIGKSEKDWNNLYRMGQGVRASYVETALWRSKKNFNAESDPRYGSVMGMRGSADTIAAVTLNLYAPSTFGPSGLLYLDREGAFKAHIKADVNALKILAGTSSEFTFDVRKKEGEGYFGKTRFEMSDSVRAKLIRMEPETDLRFLVQEKEGGRWTVYQSSRQDMHAKLGSIALAYRWATVPSAMGK